MYYVYTVKQAHPSILKYFYNEFLEIKKIEIYQLENITSE